MSYQFDPYFWKMVALLGLVPFWGIIKIRTGHWPWFWLARLCCMLEAAQDRSYDAACAAAKNFAENYQADVARVRLEVAGGADDVSQGA